ncbi:hypothetical protein BD560DRAFT_476603 [Blakeslea trispora]|nr:hypothetical protein BD560DRAFT_476603 [Blakeslea trispora]
MNNQDIINALNQMQFTLQRTFMNECQIMTLKLDKLAQENQHLREEVTLLRNEINVLTSVAGNASTSALPATSNSLFLNNSSPLRDILKKEVTSTRNFGWDVYRKLAERVLGRVLSEDEFKAYCKDNVNVGLLNPLMYSIKKKHGLLNSKTSYAKLPSSIREEAGLLLEERAAPFLPLAACAGRWGAKMLLMRMWHRSSQDFLVELDQEEQEEEDQEEDQEEEQEEEKQEEEEHEQEEHNDIDHYESDVSSDLSLLALDPSIEHPFVESHMQYHAEVDKFVDTLVQRKRGRPSTKEASKKSSAGKRIRTFRR